MRTLTDEDLAGLTPEVAVDAARESLRQFGAGQLAAPPRVRGELRDIDYLYTTGQLADGTSGFRCYRAGSPPGDELTAVWEPSGRLRGVIVGDELGARRTGALGAVAVDTLARPDARTVGLVGTGKQAWAQLWALTAVRDVARVRVYSRDARHRDDFAARAGTELGLTAESVDSSAAAVRDADIVLLATKSRLPVIAASEVRPGAHVTSVGPKFVAGHETPLDLADTAAVIACDSPQQAAAYPEPFFLPLADLVSLADIMAGRTAGRRDRDDITLFCSVGLAGSDVLLASRALDTLP